MYYSLRVCVWPAHARGKPANEPPGAGPRGLFTRVRGIIIPRTSVNKGNKKEGWALLAVPALALGPLQLYPGFALRSTVTLESLTSS